MTGVTTTAEAGRRICTSTRLALVPAAGQIVHRIGTTAYGPMTPQPRGDEVERQEWSRWDTSGGRTLYLGSTATVAFAESLPYGAESLPQVPLTNLFDDIDPKTWTSPFRPRSSRNSPA